MNIIRATVLKRHGFTDSVTLYTELPSPFPKAFPDEKLSVKFEANKDSGVEYVRTNFGIEPQVINM